MSVGICATPPCASCCVAPSLLRAARSCGPGRPPCARARVSRVWQSSELPGTGRAPSLRPRFAYQARVHRALRRALQRRAQAPGWENRRDSGRRERAALRRLARCRKNTRCSLGSRGSDRDVLNNLLIIQSDPPTPRLREGLPPDPARRARAEPLYNLFCKKYIYTLRRGGWHRGPGRARYPGFVAWPCLTRFPPRHRRTG